MNGILNHGIDRAALVAEIREHLVAMEGAARDTLRRAVLAGGLLARLRTAYRTVELMCADVGIAERQAYCYMRMASKADMLPDDVATLGRAAELLKGKIGKPKAASPAQERQVAKLRAQGQTIRKIAGIMGLGKATVERIVGGRYNAPTAGAADEAEMRAEMAAGARVADVAKRWGVPYHTAYNASKPIRTYLAAVAELKSLWREFPDEYDAVARTISNTLARAARRKGSKAA